MTPITVVGRPSVGSRNRPSVHSSARFNCSRGPSAPVVQLLNATGIAADLVALGSRRKAEGAIKSGVGKVTGDEKLKAEGAADKVKGAAKSTIGGAKDAVRDAAKKA